MGYILVEWPESQDLMNYEGFEDNCEASLNVSGAYYVDESWYKEYLNGNLALADDVL
jgi:hypothetical protein